MKHGKFFISYTLLLVIQVLICNFLHLTQFIYLTILPMMVLLIPLDLSTVAAMLIAFASGFAVDWLADGILGLNVLALVPVALLRKPIISLVFGEEVFARGEDISIKSQGILPMSVAFIMAGAVFLIIYVWADGAGTRPFWFSLARFGASLVAGFILSLLTADLLSPEKNVKKW